MARSYDNRGRLDRAAQTRRSVVTAASAEFAERGWAGTTMVAIAERAGVAVETVYRAQSGGKAALLVAAVRARVLEGAEGEDGQLEERTRIRDVLATDGARAAIEQYVAILPEAHRKAGPLLDVVDEAAQDEGVATLLAEIEAGRLEGMRRFARDLDVAGGLKEGLPPEVAADLLWTLCSRANFEALVRERGWSDADYTAWIGRILARELLPA